jgi:hypothetical protein
MKQMTKEQIDEINELLLTHGDALTAFYDEAIRYGMKLCDKWLLRGFVIGIALVGVEEIIRLIRNKRKAEKES